MDILLKKVGKGVFHAVDETQAELTDQLKTGDVLRCKVTRLRNPRFLRKFMALVTVGFEAFEPPVREVRGLVAGKSFERFRKDVVIAAGYYDAVTDLQGRIRLEPKSLSFARMSEAEFTEVFNAVANVLLQSVLARYTRADLDSVIDRIVRF
ncbi:DUF1367 family protein [Burkholderia gladioli]|uniref:DUF1367 family protein n=1 Tax=Burkholderia gladioli TaxID=28095 RepID=UPI00163F3CDB|nr:DUF1367 family protein [Burkholderia gladioli]